MISLTCIILYYVVSIRNEILLDYMVCCTMYSGDHLLQLQHIRNTNWQLLIHVLLHVLLHVIQHVILHVVLYLPAYITGSLRHNYITLIRKFEVVLLWLKLENFDKTLLINNIINNIENCVCSSVCYFKTT